MIKNLFLSTLILSIAIGLNAQILYNQPKYYPQGTSWVWSVKDFGSQKLSFDISRHAVKGSKIINQKEYFCIETYPEEVDAEECYIREMEEQVYVYYPRLDREVLYYDFRWEKGAGCALIDIDELDYKPISKDEVNYVSLSDGHQYAMAQPYGIIQTIGKTDYANLFSLFPDGELDNGGHCYMSSFVRNGVELYHVQRHADTIHDLSCPPNVNGKVGYSKIFDLLGRQIRHSSSYTRHLPHGIYIREGKKVVVK